MKDMTIKILEEAHADLKLVDPLTNDQAAKFGRILGMIDIAIVELRWKRNV